MSWMYLHHVLFGARKHYSGTSWSILKPITLPLYLSLLKITVFMFFITDTFSILLFSMGVEQSQLLLIHLPQRGFNNKILLNRISISCMRWAPEKNVIWKAEKEVLLLHQISVVLSVILICFCLYLIVYLLFFLKGQRLRKKYFLCDTLAILNFETLPSFLLMSVLFKYIYLLLYLSLLFLSVFFCVAVVFCFVLCLFCMEYIFHCFPLITKA